MGVQGTKKLLWKVIVKECFLEDIWIELALKDGLGGQRKKEELQGGVIHGNCTNQECMCD